MPITSSRRFPRSQKLKDSCDMCSASKVRCNKEKPICSRCNQLGYPCFYSPARRMGRPHPPRNTSSRSKPRAAVESPEGQPTIRPWDESVEPESNASFDDTQMYLEHDIREETISKLQRSENDFNDAVLGFRGSTISQSGQTKGPQIDHYIFEESSRGRRKGHDEDTAIFHIDDRDNRASSIEVDELYCHAILSDDTAMLLPNTSNYSSCTSSTFDQLSEILACGEGSASDASEYDCATVAMSMLQHLNMMSTERLSSATSIGEIKAPTLDALIHTVSMAIKRVSTILVCPCSQKPDVGLLAAAVCTAILDTYGNVFHNSSRSKTHCSFVSRDANRMETCTKSLKDGPDKKVTIMRVLIELPKVANLVMQFAKRYTPDAEECSADFLPVLAASLKSRLKSMTHEATNWLAQV